MGLLDSARSLVERISKEVRDGKFDIKTVRQVFVAVPPGTDAPTISALKQNVDQLTGATGSVLDRALTLRDMIDSGAMTIQSGSTVVGSGSPTIVVPTVPPSAGTGLLTYAVPPTPENLQARSMVKGVFVQWDMPAYANSGGVQIWRSTTNAIGTASQIGQTGSEVYVDTSAVPGTTYFYWVRGVLDTGDAGAYNAVSGTSVTAGRADSNTIEDLAVSTAKIADAAVLTAKIADGNITTAKIADANITTAKIGDLQVTGAKIANATINTAHISTLDASVITAGSITTDRIQVGAATARASSTFTGGASYLGAFGSETVYASATTFSSTGAPVTINTVVDIEAYDLPSGVAWIEITSQVLYSGATFTADSQLRNVVFYVPTVAADPLGNRKARVTGLCVGVIQPTSSATIGLQPSVTLAYKSSTGTSVTLPAFTARYKLLSVVFAQENKV